MNQTILSLFDTYEDLIEIQQDLISCKKGWKSQKGDIYQKFLLEKRDELISVLQECKDNIQEIYFDLEMH